MNLLTQRKLQQTQRDRFNQHQPKTSVSPEILPLYKPNSEEKRNPQLFAYNVQNFMSREMNIPLVDFNFFDGPFVVYLSKLTLQPLPFLIRLNRILNSASKKSDVDCSRLAEDILKCELQFTKAFLSLEEFSRFVDECHPLKLLTDHGIECQELFHSVTHPESETIDVRRFLVWLCLTLQPERTFVIVQVAFKVYCSDGKETLDRLQLAEVLMVLLQCYGMEQRIMLEYITAQQGEPSASDLLKLALPASEGFHPTCQCAEVLRRFFMPKPSLLKERLNAKRRPWKDCQDCLTINKKCGRDGLCKKLEDILKRCRQCHSIGINIEDGDIKKQQ